MNRSITALSVVTLALLAACTGGGGSGGTGSALNPDPHMLRRTASYMIASDQCALVLSWLVTANGDAAPSTDISGSNTQLGAPFLDFVDAHGITWVADQVAIVSAFPSTSTGNIAPYVEISGSNTTFGIITGVYVDASGNVYATDFSNGAVDVFAAGSYVIGSNNNITPTRRITGLSVPEGIYVSNGTIYVYESGKIAEWPSSANGAVAPSTVITGSNTGLGFEGGLTIDKSGNIWVGTQLTAAIEEFAAGASGNATPIRYISGSNTNQSDPVGVAVDNQGYIYDADIGNATVNVYGPAENGNVPPAQTVSGAATKLCEPIGITVH
jgi:hypothetical protein